MKSAMAEERILAQIFREPAMLDRAKELLPEEFSSPLLGKVFGQLQQRYSQGMEVSVAVLSDLTAEEMSHITEVCQRQEGPVNMQAFDDCVRTVKDEHQSTAAQTDDDLIAIQNKLKKKKGIHT
jgi:DNA primase